MVMKKRLKRYTALLLAASMVLSSSGMTTLGTEIGSSVESSDTESSGDSGSTQGSSSEEGGSSDSASEGGSSSHEQSGGGSEDGNNLDGEGSGSEDTDSDSDSDSESEKDETDDDPDGNTSDSKDPEEGDDGNSNTSDSEASEEDDGAQTSDDKDDETTEGSHGGNSGAGSSGGGSGSGGNIGSGEIQGKPDADEPKAEDELIADEEDKKDEDDKDNEDEINDYILEAIVFPEQERAAESIRKSAMRSARMLANTLNSDETSEDNEDEIGENESDIADSSSSNYIERQVDVGDTVDDLKLPKEIILKVRPVEDEAETESEDENESDSETASKSDARKTGTDKNGSDTAETKGDEDNDSAEKDNKDEEDLEEIRIRLGEEDWLISYPDDFAGSDLSAFTSEGADILDEEGNPTGEKSEETAEYPVWVFYPNLADIDIENMEGSYIDPSDFLSANNESTLDTYAAKALAVTARVGVQPQAEGEINIDLSDDVSLKSLNASDAVYSESDATLTLTREDAVYNITGSRPLTIKFAETVKNTTLNLDSVTIDYDDGSPIDLSGVENAFINISGNNSLNAARGYGAGIFVPEDTSLEINTPEGKTGSLTAVGSAYANSAAIGSSLNEPSGKITIKGGTINATGGDSAAAIGSGAYGKAGEIIISGGNITANGGISGAAIGSGEGGETTSIRVTGGIIEATGGNAGAAIGSGSNGNSGTISVSGGELKLSAALNASTIGAGRKGSTGNISLTGGVIEATGSYTVIGADTGNATLTVGENATVRLYASGMNAIAVKNMNIHVADGSQFAAYAGQRAGDLFSSCTYNESGSAFFYGIFKAQLNGDTYFSIDEYKNNDVFFSTSAYKFIMSVNPNSKFELWGRSDEGEEADTYLGRKGSDASASLTSSYEMGDAGTITQYNDIQIEMIPYFWTAGAEDITYDSAVIYSDINSKRDIIWGGAGAETLQANALPIIDVGFVEYTDETFTIIKGYWNKNVYVEGATYNIPEEKQYEWDLNKTYPDEDPLKLQLGKGSSIENGHTLDPNHTYYFKPYAVNEAGIYIGEYISEIVGGDNSQTIREDYDEIKIIVRIADIKWPQEVEFTYGTKITEYKTNTDIKLSAYTTGSDLSKGPYSELVAGLGPEYNGTLSTIEGDIKFVKKNPSYTEGGNEPEYISIEESEIIDAGIYDGKTDSGEENGLKHKEQLYFAQFVPVDQDKYAILTEPVIVKVNRMPVVASDLTKKEKVYDNSTDAPSGSTIELKAKNTGYAILESDLANDGLTASAIMNYDNKDANKEDQNAQQTTGDRKITLTNITLSGDRADNYVIEDVNKSASISGGVILKRPITLKPARVDKWAGENFALEFAAGKSALELVPPTENPQYPNNMGFAENEDINDVCSWSAENFEDYPETDFNITSGTQIQGTYFWYLAQQVAISSTNPLTSTNYKITTAGNNFYVYQEQPKVHNDAGETVEENGSFDIEGTAGNTVSYETDGGEVTKKWYRSDVTIKPVSGRTGSIGAENGSISIPSYKKITDYTSDKQAAAGAPLSEIELTQKTENIDFRLTADSGARTFKLSDNNGEKLNIYIDKDIPTVDKDGITYSIKENNNIEGLLNKLTFGVFFNEDVTVNVPFEDIDVSKTGDISGVDALYYSLDGGKKYTRVDATDTTNFKLDSENINKATASFTIPLKQNGEVLFYVTDKAGNGGNAMAAIFDKDGEGIKLWIIENDKPQISLSVKSNGTELNATDVYNNATVDISVTDAINNNAPDSGLESVNVTITANGEEVESFNAADYRYTDGNQGGNDRLYNYTKNIVLSNVNVGDGVITVRVEAEDLAGNKYEDDSDPSKKYVEKTFNLDFNAPTVDIINAPKDDYFTNAPTHRIEFTVTDGEHGSGLLSDTGSIKVSREGFSEGNYKVYEKTDEETRKPIKDDNGNTIYCFDADVNGIYHIVAEDKAGNTNKGTTEGEDQITLYIFDRIAPSVSSVTVADPSESEKYNEWYNKALTVSVTGADNEDSNTPADVKSEIAYFQYIIPETAYGDTIAESLWQPAGGIAWKTDSNTFTLNTDGDYSGTMPIKVRVVDKAGNSSKPFDLEVKLDADKPELTVNPNEDWNNWKVKYDTDNNTPWMNTAAEFTFATDNTNQVSGYDFYVSETGADDSWVKISEYAANYKNDNPDVDATVTWENNTLSFSGTVNKTLYFKLMSGSGLEDASESNPYVVKVQTDKNVEAPEINVSDWVSDDAWINDKATTATVTKTAGGSYGATNYTYYKVTRTGIDETAQQDTVIGEKLITENTVFDFDFNDDNTVEDGIYTITAYTKNSAGTQSKIVTKKVKLDTTTAETGKVTYWVAQNNQVEDFLNKVSFGIFFNKELTVNIPVTDNLSGVDKLYYQIAEENTEEAFNTAKINVVTPTEDSNNPSTAQNVIQKGTATFKLPLNTKGYIKFWTEDNADNSTANSKEILGTATEDGQPKLWIIENKAPEVEELVVTATQQDGGDGIANVGWFKSPVKVAISVKDEPDDTMPASGIGKVKYSYQPKSADGTLTGTATEKTFDTDDAPLNSADNNKEFTTTVTISEDDVYQFTVTAKDNAGNPENLEQVKKTKEIKIDTKAPEISEVKDIRPTDNLGEYSNKPYDIEFTLDDSNENKRVSGVDKNSIRVTYHETKDEASEEESTKIEGENAPVQTADGGYTFKAAKNGFYTIRVEDIAGNSSTQEFRVEGIDSEPPTATLTETSKPNLDNGYYTETSPEAYVSSQDLPGDSGSVVSGVEKIQLVYVDAEEYENIEDLIAAGEDVWQVAAEREFSANPYFEFPKEINGIVWVRFRVYDKAGNCSTVTDDNTKKFFIDNGTPELKVTHSENVESWTNSDVTFTLTGSSSGLDTYSVYIKGLIGEDGADQDGFIPLGETGVITLSDERTLLWDKDSKELKIEANERNEQIGEYYFKVTKESGSSLIRPGNPNTADGYKVMIDVTAPGEASYVVDSSENTDNTWYNAADQKEQLKINIAKPNYEENTADETTYFKLYKKAEDTEPEGDGKELTDTSFPKISKNGTADGVYTFKYKTKDAAGNETVHSGENGETVRLDSVKPSINNVKVEYENEGGFAEFINKLTFGNFFNKELRVTLTVSDVTSGLTEDSVEVAIADADTDTADLNYNTEVDIVSDTKENNAVDGNISKAKYTFTIHLDTYASEVNIRIKDIAENVLTDKLKAEDSNSLKWTVENIIPELQVELTKPNTNATNGNAEWYSIANPLRATAKAWDKDSGINNMVWSITGEDGTASEDEKIFDTESTQQGMSETNAIERSIPSEEAASYINEQGEGLKLTVKAADNSTNLTVSDSVADLKDELSGLNVDMKEPEISITNKESLEGTEEGGWTNETQTVSFSVSDVQPYSDREVTLSGIDRGTIKITKQVGQDTAEVLTGDAVSIAESADDNGAYICSFKAEENAKYTISAKDIAGNDAEDVEIVFNKIDKNPPEAPAVKVNGANVRDRWYINGELISTLSIELPSVGENTHTTYYKLWNEADGQTEESVIEETALGEANASVTIRENLGDGTWKLRVRTVDEAGNVDENTLKTIAVEGKPAEDLDANLTTIFADRAQPEIKMTAADGFNVERVNGGAIAAIGRLLSFGNFFKAGVKITVPVSDDSLGSGADKLYYGYGDPDSDIAPATEHMTAVIVEKAEGEKSGTAVITINEENFDNKIWVYATDIAGNQSGTPMGTAVKLQPEGSGDLWMIETEAPTISDLTLNQEDSSKPGKNGWRRTPVTLSATVTDEKSGLWSVKESYTYQKNDSDTPKENPEKEILNPYPTTSRISEQNYSAIFGGGADGVNDGIYKVKLTAEDNATNKTSKNNGDKSVSVKVDTQAPLSLRRGGDYDEAPFVDDTITIHYHFKDDVSGINMASLKVIKKPDSGQPESEVKFSVSGNPVSDGYHCWQFEADENGTYIISGEDNAGNPFEIEEKVTHIDSTAVNPIKLTADPTVMTITSAEGGEAGQEGGDTEHWVGPVGGELQVKLTPASAADGGTAPVHSYYKLYNPLTNGRPSQDAPEITAKPEELNATEFIDEIPLDLDQEGKYTLYVWYYKEGETDESTGEQKIYSRARNIFVDRTAPEIEVETKADIAVGVEGRTVQFTVKDFINNKQETNTHASGIQLGNVKVTTPSGEVLKYNSEGNGGLTLVENKEGKYIEFTFSFVAKENGTYKINATDRAGHRLDTGEIGNAANKVEYIENMFDDKAPKNASVEYLRGTEDASDADKVLDGKDWYAKPAPTVKITAPTEEVVVGNTELTTHYVLKRNDVQDQSRSGELKAGEIKEIELSPDGKWDIEVWTVDAAGNMSDNDSETEGNQSYTRTVYVDTRTPELISVTTEEINTSSIAKLINSLSFGIFFNEGIKVTVTAATDEDANAGENISGLNKLYYKIGAGADFKEEDISNGTASFEFDPDDFKDSAGNISAKDIILEVDDKAGNRSDSYYLKEDRVASESDLSTKWTLETVDPSITFEEIKGKNDNGFINTAYTLNYEVTDPDSYLDKVYVKKSTAESTETPVFDKDRDTAGTTGQKSYSGKVELNKDDAYTTEDGNKVYNDDGIYTIEVKAIDNAGNEVTKSSEELKLDRTAPVIAADIESDVENWDSIWHKANEVTLTVKATDNLSGFSTEESETVSGIKVEKTYNGTKKDVEVTETIDSTSQGKTIKGSFKLDTNGTYKVTVTDMAGNTATKEITVLWIDDKLPADIDESGKIGDETVVSFEPAEPSAVTGWYNNSTDDSDPAKDNTGTPKITINAVQEDSMREDGAQDLEETDTSKITTRYELYCSDSEGDLGTPVASGRIPDVNAKNSVMLNHTDSGYYTLKIKRADAAGNESPEDYVKTFKIDAKLPDIVSVTEDSEPALTSKTVFVVAADDFSGLYTDAADIKKSIEVEHYVEDVNQNTEINIRVANEKDKTDSKYPQNVSEGQTVYAFDVCLKGEYRIYVTDIAGNTRKASVEYQYIDSKQPDAPVISVYGGEYDSETGWYKLDTEPDNFDNAPYFKLEPKFSEDTVTPYTLHYRMWNAKDPAHDSESAPLFTTGDDTTDSNVAINTDGEPGLSEAEIVEADNWVPAAGGSEGYLKIEVPTDGEWYLKAWTESASGLESSKPDPANFKLDRVRPETDTDEENGGIAFDLTNDNPIAEFINWLSFGNFFNQEIKVTVYVKDETSFAREDEGIGYTVYDPEDENKVLSSGTADIKYTAGSDSKKGSGSFTIPVGTDGNIFISLTDNAGNVKDKISLVKDGSNRWIIENQAPQFVEIDPTNGARDVVIADLDAIRIYYAEWVEPTGKADIEITVSGNTYTADMTSPEVTVAITDGTGVASSSTPSSVDEARKQAVVTVPISLFKDGQGNALNILPDNVYAVTLYDGALRDLARNENTVVNSFFITQPASELPAAIEDITVTPGEEGGLYMNPSEFDEDVKEYIIAGMDEAFDENGNMLEDIVIDPRFSDQASDNDATDADITKAVLRDKDDPSVEIALTVNGDGTCTVPENLIEEGKDYEIEITADLNGREDTYTFSLYTGMLTAEIKPSDEEAPSTMPDITVSAEDLKASVDRSKLMPHFLKGEKIKLTMTIAVPSAEVIGDEITAFTEYDKANGRTRSVYGYYPFDIKITKTSSAGNETELITELDEPIDLRIEMPDSVKGRDIYGVLGHHNGQVIDMAYTVPDDESYIEIHDLSKFSIYAISYKGKSTGGGTGGSSGGGGGSGGGPSGSGGSGAGTVTVSGTTAYYGGTWVNDGYLFIESDGNRPSNEWLRIDGKLYRFGLDGFRTTAYLQYKFNPDGSLNGDLPADIPVRDATGTWLKDGWWYKTVSGGYLAGGWYYLFYQGRFEWYYFNADGWMLDGWLTLTDTPGDGGPADTSEVNPDGTPVQRTYYLHTTHDWTRGRMYTDWHFIDGKWYYFRTKPEGNEGSLVRNGITLTGHHVGPDGAWDGVGPTPTEAQ